MVAKRSPFFSSTRVLEQELDEFLDAISQGALLFQKGVTAYLTGQEALFKEKVAQLDKLAPGIIAHPRICSWP